MALQVDDGGEVTALLARIEPPAPLSTVRAEGRRAEILDGIESIVLTEGFRGLRLTDLARRLSTSSTTLYQLAASKDELLLLVIDRWQQRSGRRAWRLLAATTDSVDRLRVWLAAGVHGGARASSAQFWSDVDSHAAVRQLVDRYRRYYSSVLELLVTDGVARGELRAVNPELAAVVFAAATAKLREPDVAARFDDLEPDLGTQLVDLVLTGVLGRRS